MIAVAGMASTAMARDFSTGHLGTTSIDGLSRGTSNFTTTVSFDTVSVDGPGAPGNTVIEVFIGANNSVTALGWDVNIETIGLSWLSEVVFNFDDTTGANPNSVNVTPAPGDGMGTGVNDQPGMGNFASGGLVDLTDAGLGNLTVGADGILRIEIFEGYDDGPGPDAFVDGSFTIGLLNEIPAPGAVALFGLGGLAAARRRR